MAHQIIQLISEDYDNFTTFDNFITLICDYEKKEAMIVDPAWDALGIMDVLEEEGLKLTAILVTHAHHDHINAVNKIYQQHDIALFISEKEYNLWEDCPEDAVLIEDGDQIQFGSEFIDVIATPGHTPGSCCFHIGNDLITGDTLFIYGCGRADLLNGSAEDLYDSLQKLKKLPEETRIWVGHNYSIVEESTIGKELKGNPFLLIDNKADFLRYRLGISQKTRKMPYEPMSRAELTKVLAEYK